MKKGIYYIVILVALFIFVRPTNAQSLKEKKAAKKEQWEREKKQEAEEDALYHKFRIDSIANAQKSHMIVCYRLNRIRSGWSKVTKHGYYNIEDGILMVDNERFSVEKNPYYGEKSTPGSYQYKAGPYYFNE